MTAIATATATHHLTEGIRHHILQATLAALRHLPIGHTDHNELPAVYDRTRDLLLAIDVATNRQANRQR